MLAGCGHRGPDRPERTRRFRNRLAGVVDNSPATVGVTGTAERHDIHLDLLATRLLLGTVCAPRSNRHDRRRSSEVAVWEDTGLKLVNARKQIAQ
jgi:hypothetical protein